MPSPSPGLLTSPARTRQPGLRLVPTPRWEPPYEDSHARRLPSAPQVSLEPVGSTDPVQGTLALTFLLPSGLPALPSTPLLRLVEPALRGSTDDDTDFDPQPTSSAHLPDARFWAGRLTQAILEVEAGVRPVTQLRRWTSDAVYAQLRRQSNRRRVIALREADRRRSPGLAVRSVRVCEPDDGIAEVCAVVHDGSRPRALAMRLEGTDGRWRCTVIERP